MRINVNKIRLSALSFDVTVAFTKRGREPGAKGQGDKPAGSRNFCPSSPIQQQTQQTVSESSAQEEEIEPNLPASCANGYRRRPSSRTGCRHPCGEP